MKTRLAPLQTHSEWKRPLSRSLLALALVGGFPATAAHAISVQSFKAAKNEDVWFVSDHTLPMIALTAALPAGSAYDPASKPGLASFAASLLDEGGGKLDATAFQTALSNRGIRLTATPDRDYLIVSLITLTDNAKDAFQLLGLALSRPRFDQDAIQRIRAQMLVSLAQQREEPESVARKAFYHAWFHDHPYGHDIDGDVASISAINLGDLRQFAAGHWVAGGLKVAVAGDFTQTQLTQLLRAAFGSLSSRTPAPPPTVGKVGQGGIQILPMPVSQSTVVFGLPGMMRNDRDYLGGYVANYILGGGGFSSRLTNEVREKRGLTYDISTSFDTYRRAGVVTGEVASRRGAIKETIELVRQTLRAFAANGPTQSELDDAKTYLTGSFPLEFSSNVGIASQLNSFQRVGLSPEYVKKRNSLIAGVTLDDVARAARRMFNPVTLTVVVAGGLGESAGTPQNVDTPVRNAHASPATSLQSTPSR